MILLGARMSEVMAAGGVVVGTLLFLVLGVKLGTQYIDKTFTLAGRSRSQTPLVRPAHPSGLEWHSVDAA
jgi:hypothetical protein